MSAAVFTVLTAMFMCGCTSDKNTVGQSTEYNGRGGRTPAETAFLTDGKRRSATVRAMKPIAIIVL